MAVCGTDFTDISTDEMAFTRTQVSVVQVNVVAVDGSLKADGSGHVA